MSFPLNDYELSLRRDLLTSRIVSLFLESGLYGAFAVTYFIGVRKLLSKKQPRAVSTRNVILLATNSLMLGLATAHLALTIYMLVYSFVTKGSDRESIYQAFLSFAFQTRTPKAFEAQHFIYVTQTALVFGGFMIYSLWAVWGKKRVLAVPVIFFLADIGLGYSRTPESEFAETYSEVFFLLTTVTYLLFAALLMARIIPSLQQKGSLSRALTGALVQSGIIYALASLAIAITSFQSPDVGRFISESILSPLMGVVMGLMIIGVARESKDKQEDLPLLNAPERHV